MIFGAVKGLLLLRLVFDRWNARKKNVFGRNDTIMKKIPRSEYD